MLQPGGSRDVQQYKQREDKILSCYEKTVMLDAWSWKRHKLCQKSVEKGRVLFPNIFDFSGLINGSDTDKYDS